MLNLIVNITLAIKISLNPFQATLPFQSDDFVLFLEYVDFCERK